MWLGRLAAPDPWPPTTLPVAPYRRWAMNEIGTEHGNGVEHNTWWQALHLGSKSAGNPESRKCKLCLAPRRQRKIDRWSNVKTTRCATSHSTRKACAVDIGGSGHHCHSETQVCPRAEPKRKDVEAEEKQKGRKSCQSFLPVVHTAGVKMTRSRVSAHKTQRNHRLLA